MPIASVPIEATNVTVKKPAVGQATILVMIGGAEKSFVVTDLPLDHLGTVIAPPTLGMVQELRAGVESKP